MQRAIGFMWLRNGPLVVFDEYMSPVTIRAWRSMGYGVAVL